MLLTLGAYAPVFISLTLRGKEEQVRGCSGEGQGLANSDKGGSSGASCAPAFGAQGDGFVAPALS